MHRRFYLLLALFGLLLTVLPAAAQKGSDLSEVYTFDDGTTFSYPESWTLEDDPDYLLTLYDDETQLWIVEFAAFEDMGYGEADSLNEIAEAYFESIYEDEGLKFSAQKVDEVEIGGREAVRYDYKDTYGDDAFLLVLRFSDGTYGLIDAWTLTGDWTEEDLVLDIAATLDRGSEDVRATGSGEACFVSTEQSGVVSVRVGPGENRTSYSFLPAGQEFAVLGQAEAGDGSLWYKLDKDAVAPGNAAAEAWVAASDVETSGACDQVVDVNAPPIIPIVSAPPVTASGGDQGGSQSGQAASAGEIIPLSGSWTSVYPASAPGSCLGYETVNLDISWSAETYSLSVSGGTLTYGGISFRRINPGVYQFIGDYGVFDSDGTPLNSVVTIRVASTTRMSVEVISNMTFDDVKCSVTVTGTMTRN